MSFRLLEVLFSYSDQLIPVHQWEIENMANIKKRLLRVFFTRSKHFEIVLYGMDKNVKWRTSRVQDLNKVFEVIDAMPRGKEYSGEKPTVASTCGIFTDPLVRHCFRDVTHQTCCLLGKNARKYADASGNPIGNASEKAFANNYGFLPSENTLTPWCTCIGSQVCTYYTQKFGKEDGTHIKFIHQNNTIIMDQQERKYQKYRHRTPGVF